MARRSARVSIPFLATITVAVLLGVSGAVLATSSSPSIRDAAPCPVTFQPGVLDVP